jgi:hypothetical protein
MAKKKVLEGNNKKVYNRGAAKKRKKNTLQAWVQAHKRVL